VRVEIEDRKLPARRPVAPNEARARREVLRAADITGRLDFGQHFSAPARTALGARLEGGEEQAGKRTKNAKCLVRDGETHLRGSLRRIEVR
jgi:hypothetical protein